MRILILGGDGYLGWPTSMYLSARGHRVHAMDNYLRRRAHREAGTDSLVPILESLPARAAAWHEVTGYRIEATEGDVLDWDLLAGVVRGFEPEAIIHYAEIASAPYSHVDREHAMFTQHNNVTGTMNVLFAMEAFAPEAHLVKLGSMGEYGTPDVDIEEGFLDVHHRGRTDRLPYPKQPASWYHASKVHDSTNVQMACAIWGLRATDLNQGVVYGTDTEETRLDPRLCTRFDYDEVWGTALNRWCVQAVIGHPLTVYGSGEQIRAYLNILDTMACVELSLLNPPALGEYRVFNQFTEQFSLNELAGRVVAAGRDHGLDVALDHLDNPRVEADRHHYHAAHSGLVDLGLKPHLLSATLLESMFDGIERHRDRIDLAAIPPRTRWRP